MASMMATGRPGRRWHGVPMDPTELLHSSMPLCATFGMRGLRFDAEAVEVELDWAESLCTSGGLLHGGALMALADAAG